MEKHNNFTNFHLLMELA